MVSLAERHSGKLCAAFDRQHPHDFYDVWSLLESRGFTEEIRRALVVYLGCHSRFTEELLSPRWKHISHHVASEFMGMANENITPELLQSAPQ
ncbi:nucleotidyl transferase AbiEii/AbiGii toxin family protein [Isoalcanivorax beigongshangi]|uniref:Nucleotidyl transferase AbiEii/AbiGii toxin family protein n=1 Tax=Isoalcanivorax beigongshangi TaxID=3238810 RepID=A0ABV4AE78_9GAMM